MKLDTAAWETAHNRQIVNYEQRVWRFRGENAGAIHNVKVQGTWPEALNWALPRIQDRLGPDATVRLCP